jgi:predicted Fe-Mo cluster-binding NifX family protein
MKVAVTVFKNRVSPRIDVSDSLFIYEIDAGTVEQIKIIPLGFEYPAELISLLQQNGINKILCGGCPHFFSRALLLSGFELLSGLSGDTEQVMKMLAEGKLEHLPGRGPAGSFARGCGRKRRARQGKRKNQ